MLAEIFPGCYFSALPRLSCTSRRQWMTWNKAISCVIACVAPVMVAGTRGRTNEARKLTPDIQRPGCDRCLRNPRHPQRPGCLASCPADGKLTARKNPAKMPLRLSWWPCNGRQERRRGIYLPAAHCNILGAVTRSWSSPVDRTLALVCWHGSRARLGPLEERGGYSVGCSLLL